MSDTPYTVDDVSRDIFTQLRLTQFGNLGLAATEFDGIPCDVVISLDGMDAGPVAILVNDDIFQKLANPADADDWNEDMNVMEAAGRVAFVADKLAPID